MIRSMTPGDLGQALALSTAEGWNQTEKDWRLLLENPGNICIVAEKEGSIIGTATALNHSNQVAWIGMVLVDKGFRGQGVGKLLMTAIIERLNKIPSIKLDATPAGYHLYQNLGFNDECEIYRMTNPSFQGIATKPSVIEPERINFTNFPEVLELDRRISGYDRSYLLKSLLSDYPEKAFLIRKDRKAAGYVFGRNGVRFNYAGPVGALMADSAVILITEVLKELKDKPVALDIRSDRKEMINWLESVGFVKQRNFIRMFLKSNSYSGLPENQYLIAGPEFG